PDLDAETAKIITAGVVYEPTFVPGFSIAVDYFNIRIDNAIQPIGASVILGNCYNAPPDQRTNCDKLTRMSDGYLDLIMNLEDNIGGTDTAGVDFNVRYVHNTGVG